MDDAKELCQQIAAGEIDLEALRAEYDAEDADVERAAVRTATEAARAFHNKLEAVGISCMSVGNTGRNTLALLH